MGEGGQLTGWQPIATAPRDGSRFDAWACRFCVGPGGNVTATDGCRFADVYWGTARHVYANPTEVTIGQDGWVCDDGINQELVELGSTRITHWMPLPHPPVTQ